MPGTTPVYGFPYLIGTDGGKQIKTVSETLALTLEATLSGSGQVPLDADLVDLLQRLAALEDQGEFSTSGIVSVYSSNFTLISQQGLRKAGRAQIFVVLQRTGGGAVDLATVGGGGVLTLLDGWKTAMPAAGQGLASTHVAFRGSAFSTGAVPVNVSPDSLQVVDYFRPGGGSIPLNAYFGVYLDYALEGI